VSDRRPKTTAAQREECVLQVYGEEQTRYGRPPTYLELDEICGVGYYEIKRIVEKAGLALSDGRVLRHAHATH